MSIQNVFYFRVFGFILYVFQRLSQDLSFTNLAIGKFFASKVLGFRAVKVVPNIGM